MKTRRIASITSGLLTFLVAALILLSTTACEKDPPIINFEEDEALSPGYFPTQKFWVYPEGGTVNLFDGAIELFFPEGAVPNYTELTMTTFPAHYLDLEGYNLYYWGFTLENDFMGAAFPNRITFRIRYDMAEESWLKDLPASEEDLQIYRVSPTPYSFERIVPVEECCVNCNCKIVRGCVSKYGSYVVGWK